MRIISFNANGLRSAASKGFFDWFGAQDADVLCVQETKAQEHQLAALLDRDVHEEVDRVRQLIVPNPERGQRLAQHHRPGAWAAAAMRGREGLVQVDVHGVDAEIAWPHPADDG